MPVVLFVPRRLLQQRQGLQKPQARHRRRLHASLDQGAVAEVSRKHHRITFDFTERLTADALCGPRSIRFETKQV